VPDLIWTALGWLPLWILARLTGSKPRPRRVLVGMGLAGFVGGMCAVELRRHGLLSSAAGALPLGLFGLHLDEILQFSLLGGGSVFLTEWFLDRAGIGR
jgi:hypothetical protein